MNHDTRRITLISRSPQLAEHSWDRSRNSRRRLVLLDSFTMLRHAMSSSFGDVDADVERVILDRSCSASDYLLLLAELPSGFMGDILMIRDDESGFLSSAGRGGDRVLYALASTDVDFYLKTHNLVAANAAMPNLVPAPQSTVIPFRPRTAVA